MTQVSFRVLAKQIFFIFSLGHFLMEKGAPRKFPTGSGCCCEKHPNFVQVLLVIFYVLVAASELGKNTVRLCSSFAWV